MNSRIYTHQQGAQEKVSKSHRKTVQMLKDLIRVNKDRITGYEKAAYEENKTGGNKPQENKSGENKRGEDKMDPDLRNILCRMATDSRSYVNDLHAEVIRLGGAPVTQQDTITGKIYLFWLDLRVDFGGKGHSAISSLLCACSFGEEAIQKVYRRALDSGDELPSNILHLLERQLGDLEGSHRQIKNISDEYNDNNRSL
jgi:uncharacterized protein (TIGR02284 family)